MKIYSVNNCNYSEIKLAVIGGDLRQTVMSNELADMGFEIALCGMENFGGKIGKAVKCRNIRDAINKASMIILPMPFSNDGENINCPFGSGKIKFSDIVSEALPHQPIIGGKLSEGARSLAERKSLRLIDYYEREDLNILNSVPTAEGAVEIAMHELPITLHGCRTLVLGFGRLGKALCSLLKGIGAEVCAAARKPADFAAIEIAGYEKVNINQPREALKTADVIFNTVPAGILTSELLSVIRPETLIIDLASKPGGVDYSAAGEFGLKVIWALSLPGKTAPVTAGRIMKKCVINILTSEGII